MNSENLPAIKLEWFSIDFCLAQQFCDKQSSVIYKHGKSLREIALIVTHCRFLSKASVDVFSFIWEVLLNLFPLKHSCISVIRLKDWTGGTLWNQWALVNENVKIPIKSTGFFFYIQFVFVFFQCFIYLLFFSKVKVGSNILMPLIIFLVDTNRVVWGFQDSVGERKRGKSGVADSAPSFSLESINGFLWGCYMNKGISCITLKSCLFCKSEDVYSHRWLCFLSVLANQNPPFSKTRFWAVGICE